MFQVKFVAIAELDDSQIPFRFALYPVRKATVERLATFIPSKAQVTEPVPDYGLTIEAGERVSLCGVQAQSAVYCTSPKGGNVKTYELLDNGKGGTNIREHEVRIPGGKSSRS